jgi:UDP-galactopyranose mutase
MRCALICFSHLRWRHVWQRPHHLLSRFARCMPVFVVEEPTHDRKTGEDDSLCVATLDGVTVLTPSLGVGPPPKWGFEPATNPRIRRLLDAYFAAWPLDPAGTALWYYTPMALGAEPSGLADALVVYDAMDDLASFHGAPPAIRAREAELLGRADVVFAGGPSLAAARRDRRPDTVCVPSGVEPGHYARAVGLPRPPELAGRPGPVVGYAGVLDERLDPNLLAHLADARPGWTVALVGPLAKIARTDLPARPNILAPGKRPYDELPAYLGAFDAGILPFARNRATRFISPTKTLEYLAAGLPVVSTPIPDVVALYGDVVAVAATPAEFVAAVGRAVGETAAERQRRLAGARAVVAAHDWDAIAAGMHIRLRQARAAAPAAK